ncbi:hypothetical protein [Streptomyces sp. NPDC048392]|uniref:hypothetical protein n=1 Tax=Streptomyces sp. NPDC048392 TaxID=3365543 RepID=UPI003713B80B
MTAAPGPATNVAVELAQLRGETHTGLEQIKGTLGVLVERTPRTDADVRQLRADMEKEIDDLQKQIDELNRGRWPLAQIGALAAVVGVVAAVIALFLT